MPGITDRTPILLIDGRTMTPEALKLELEKSSGKGVFGYGIDSYNDVNICKFESVTKSKEKEPLSQILLKDGSYLKEFAETTQLLKLFGKAPVPGTVVDLAPGSELYPLIRFPDSDGHEVVVRLKENHLSSVYRMADFYNVKMGVYTDDVADLYYPSHIDRNKVNNHPSNIKRLNPEEAGIKPLEKKSIFQIAQEANRLTTMPDRAPDIASMTSKKKDADPNYYQHDDRQLEATERFKLAEARRAAEQQADPVISAALATSYIVDLIEPLPDPTEDFVYEIKTDTGNYAIGPGIFIKA